MTLNNPHTPSPSKIMKTKLAKLKCKCIPNDTESFCTICCPEMYECLEEPHIQAYIEEKLNKAKPTKYQIGDKVWILGDHKIEQKTVCGACLYREYVEGKDKTFTRYQLESARSGTNNPSFFYTEKRLFATREALIDSLCS